ncbi:MULTISPECIES: flagellar biosynthetic protein FliR [Anoxybacillus]|uniref:Flagellar biosynthetic protein FliR n=1 Tax=Anoxybacillus gonensis TaxID=198467 RepID=A0AAW7TGQ7_9BACL|nr:MULTISPECIES: flagellar biosynthetic protein FliR [Anoxybacillus]AXM87872.1 flagellar type III secretion system protein FliR [Anoxybacillus ayderensis G10]THD16337.1 flagellar type III secretion system protein FliR [Anoxybacillus ayderensis]MBW9217010.1 flagellar type III secretion system protein FliR [Anoxybacillus sp. ST70]MCX8045356.1 flagellar biosynthetic protein FliR [Anoxybacillus gonensis]MDO0877269.1 flagellar type III secretion system protein FliR [Anoxybacillus gonensis]
MKSMELYTYVPTFLLIFARVASFFATMPLFSYRNVPNVHKIGFAFFISWIMFFSLDPKPIDIDGTYMILLIKEVLVGLLIGLVAFIVMSAIQIAGGFIDFQMGFAIANVIDPQTGAQSPLMGQYLYTIVLFFLLSVNGHHLLLDGIFYSYQFIPLERLISFGNGQIAEQVVRLFQAMFVIALQMAIPIVGCLFLVDVALGIVARTVPQMNIFVIGLPVKIIVSFVLFVIVFSSMFVVTKQLFEFTFTSMRGMMKLLGGA